MTFSADLGKYAKKIGKTLDQTHRGVVIKLFSAVINDTPVLDGFLRGAWSASKNAPDLTPKKRADKSKNGPTVTMAIRQAGNAGDIVFLANSMPYAMRVEYEGWSHTKAPEGMVRRNVARIEAIVKEAVAGAR